MATSIGFLSSFPHLTPRQFEVLSLLNEGMPNKIISRQLGISAATAKAHVSGVLRALKARSRLEAVLVAHRSGLLTSLSPQVEPALLRPLALRSELTF